jgi:radical SAM protein with 4Fe4S-binding SPASM domain
MKCFATTNSVMIGPTGYVSPCCKYKGDFGHIEDYHSIAQILDSDHYTNLRLAHAADDFTEGCVRCKHAEDRGYRSRRLRYDTRFTSNDFLLDISPGLFCNLKCRMCSASSSTSWFSDSDALVKMGITEVPLSKTLNVYNMPDSDVDKIISFLEDNDYEIAIEFKGGEPLMNPATRNLFERMAASTFSNRINVDLITNGTYNADWLGEIACKFKKFHINVSADGIDDVYEYIRGDKKHTWKRFLEVFESYKKIPGISLSFNYVVQNTNVHQIAEFANAVAPYGVNWIMLNNPYQLATTVIPLGARADIIQKVKPVLKMLCAGSPQYNTIENILTELDDGIELDEALYIRFIKYSAALDKLRNQNLLKVAPHLITSEGKKLYDNL